MDDPPPELPTGSTESTDFSAPKRLNRKAPLIVIALILLAAGGAYVAFFRSSNRVISGTLLLEQRNYEEAGGCLSGGFGGYDDIHVGAEVIVENDAGKIIGTSELSSVEPVVLDITVSRAEWCRFSFTVTASDAAFYQIKIGHRSGATYSRTDLAEKGWRVDLTLGP